MTKQHLQKGSIGVAHKSAKRTRLRVSKKYRHRETLHPVKEAIANIPGVTGVEVNPQTGSILVHHDEQPGILASISEAIEQTAPELLLELVMPEEMALIAGAPAVSGLLKSLAKVVTGEDTAADEGYSENADGAQPARSSAATIKRMVPAAFAVAGIYKLIETESLLAGMAPLVLFYYAFDSYWKLSEEDRVKHIEQNLAEGGKKAT